ncbi:MAG: hypothetical protein LBH24_03520 [Clostridiales bacterium]|nr:hypothetical protein [Clostridiales bacterium]
MNMIWMLLLISGTAVMLFTNPDGILKAMLDGATGAVGLAMQLVAMYAFWLGFFALLERTGAAGLIAKILRPLIRFLFKDIDEKTEKFISMNMSANLLGLGNASTPMGIGAINAMNDGKKAFATTNMIMLAVISATSLQLIPSTVISMRIAHGSTDPTAFLLPCIVSTVSSTVIGILSVKLLSRALGREPKTRRGREKRAKTGGRPLPLGDK